MRSEQFHVSSLLRSAVHSSQDISHWIDQLKEGNSVAAGQIWHLYFERLIRAVRQRLRGQNRAVSDEEDIVASVFESFYQAAEAGRFPELSDRDDLWRLLLSMSARKVIDKRRRDQRQRRGGGIQLHSIDGDAERSAMFEVVGDSPSPEMVAMMTESMEQLFSHLSDERLKAIAIAKLEGLTNAEIAANCHCSERTIERRLHLIREKCEQELL